MFKAIHKYELSIAEIVSGGQMTRKEVETENGTDWILGGADYLGECWARSRGIRVTQFPADWRMYGSEGGKRRNVTMAEYVNGNGFLVAIWQNHSPGTAHMIQEAKKRGIDRYVVRI